MVYTVANGLTPKMICTTLFRQQHVHRSSSSYSTRYLQQWSTHPKPRRVDSPPSRHSSEHLAHYRNPSAIGPCPNCGTAGADSIPRQTAPAAAAERRTYTDLYGPSPRWTPTRLLAQPDYLCFVIWKLCPILVISSARSTNAARLLVRVRPGHGGVCLAYPGRTLNQSP